MWMFEFSLWLQNAFLFENHFNEILKTLQLHCNLFKNPQFGPIQNSEFLQFNHLCFYKIKLSLFWLLNGLSYLNCVSNIAQTVFKSQMIYVIEFIEKYLMNCFALYSGLPVILCNYSLVLQWFRLSTVVSQTLIVL